MTFRIRGIDPQPFEHLFNLSDAELAAQNIVRQHVTTIGGYPERIELRDAQPGESVLLLNYLHQPADTPYRSSHAIYIREGASTAFDALDTIPPALNKRMISLRAFDANNMLFMADIADPGALAVLIERFLAEPRSAYLHAHFAKWGCYAARVTRD